MDSARTAVVLRYHEATKHRIQAYARGPEALDWDAQPSPFRRYEGAAELPLPLSAGRFDAPMAALYTRAHRAPAEPGLEALGALLQLSLALSAWKSTGVDRWAVRVNPSSGNLHPTEAYLLAEGIPGLAAGLYHYRPEDHCLELRARSREPGEGEPPRLWVGLSSLMWREAWKYGERAFRYCQLDLGHATAALAYAAGLLGWELRPASHVPSSLLGRLLGLDRGSDFPEGRRAEVEREEPELLCSVAFGAGDASPAVGEAEVLARVVALAEGGYAGKASRVDPRPLYEWPAIDDVARASRVDERAGRDVGSERPACAEPRPAGPRSAREVVLKRRSGQRYDLGAVMPTAAFTAILDACLPRAGGPWLATSHEAKIALVLFVHRVEGFAPGVYLLPRYPGELTRLAHWLKPELAPKACEAAPAALGLSQLAAVEPKLLARLTRAFSCHQDIASTSCFSLGMLCEFDEPVARDASLYRTLYREAGALGQVLYLEAEAQGYRGTGIGCFFDDVVHDLLSGGGQVRQSLYHFAIGRPLDDGRIESSPPYPERMVGAPTSY
jgi:SagB-type dehydrogenase family enzyme